MINRLRCHEWSPLATQQLRLRNLIQITGHNIEADEKTSIYYTLHFSQQLPPFLTSEPIKSTKNAIWSEIDCQNIEKTTSQMVAVRVWQCRNQLTIIDTINSRRQSIDSLRVKNDDNIKKNISEINGATGKFTFGHGDKLLFTWIVYFSGLVPIIKRSHVKLANNALIFCIHGAFFTSAAYLLPECIPDQYNYFYTTFKRQSSDSNLHTDRDSENDDELTSTFGSTINIGILYSPDSSQFDDSKLCDPNRLKRRFLEYSFPKSEIRPSYCADELRKLQENQRNYRKVLIECSEMRNQIYTKSLFCSNFNLSREKRTITTSERNSSIGRTLGRLLSNRYQRPSTEIIFRAQELRRKIESAKICCRILTSQRNQHKIQLQALLDKNEKLLQEHIDEESLLVDSNRELNRNRDMVVEINSIIQNKLKISRNVNEKMVRMQHHRLMQLKDIFHIEKCIETNLYKINGIHLPNSNELRVYGFVPSQMINTPISLSVAMGNVAQTVVLCASILNIPLRNEIILCGSASKIRDDIKKLPDNSREFPLFCRKMPPSDALLYALYLLNQDILQIKFMLNVNITRDDIRATLENVLDILSIGEMASDSNRNSDSVSNTVLIDDINELPIASISNASIDKIGSLQAVNKITNANSEQNISQTHFKPLRKTASF